MFTVGIPAVLVCLVLLRAARQHPPYSGLVKGKCLAGFVLQVSAEELGEMIGVSLIVWGTWEGADHAIAAAVRANVGVVWSALDR